MVFARSSREGSAARPESVALEDAADRRLTRLVRSELAVVWRSLRRLGLSQADADDAAQEVMLVLARRLEVVTEGSERAFLLATAVRVASTRRRSVRRRGEHDDSELAELLCDSPSPEELSSLREARALLDRTLETMDADARAAFVLHELEHLSTPAIAAALSVPEGTISTRLRRARAVFQAAVAREAARRALEDER